MFDLIREKDMPEYDGASLYYVHRETGMEVFHIRNGDVERCASFMFSTPSEDSKGVAHILEHTVLCGSRRFPVKDPFSQVLLSSPNTFLNAITFADKTMYPFATPLKKDFDILFDIYADAVFDPLLRRESFQQEGIRSFDGKFDGVVFNEMCGARSTEDSAVTAALNRHLFQGTAYQYDSGGDPLHIVDLTYEEYLERYAKWYSPSNCRLFLFGDLDTGRYLDLLEERYLKNREKGVKIIPKSAYYMQFHLKPMRRTEFCPAGDARSTVLSWITTPGDDPLGILTASVLVDILLGNPGAPLYKAIAESGLGEDLNPLSGIDVDGPVLVFTAGFSHAKEGGEAEIEAFLMDELSSYAVNGLPEEAVRAAIKRMEFKIQEIPGDGIPFGIATCLRASRSWLRGGSPEDGVSSMERLERLKERVAEGGFFEKWIKCNLLDNPRRLLLTVRSSDTYDSELQKSLSSKMDRMVSMGLAGSEEQKKAYENFIASEDSPEALSSIPRITVKDLPRAIARYPKDGGPIGSGARFYDYSLFTRGIVYLSIAFDTLNLDMEEKALLPLLVRAMQMCGTGRQDFSRISTRLRLLTGGFYMLPNAGADIRRNPVSHVLVKAKMLRSDLKDACDLIAEILPECDLTDEGRLKASLSDMVTEFESGFSYSGNSYAVMNASSVFSASAKESETLMGASLWLRLSQMKKDLESGRLTYGSLSAKLTKLHSKVFVQRSMKIHASHDEGSDDVRQIVCSFVDRFKVGKFVRKASYYRGFKRDAEIGTVDRPVVYTVPSGPAFNALAIRMESGGEADYVASSLLSSVLSSGYLWNTVRGVNGAYGVESHVDGMENLFVFSSYRDPLIGQTFKTYIQSLSQEIGEDEVEYAIVTIIGREIRPLSPSAKSAEAFRRILFGMNTGIYLRRRKILLGMRAEDLKAVAGKVLGSLGDSSAVVVCGADMAGKVSPLKSIALPL